MVKGQKGLCFFDYIAFYQQLYDVFPQECATEISETIYPLVNPPLPRQGKQDSSPYTKIKPHQTKDMGCLCRFVLGARKKIELCQNIDKAREAEKSGEVILLNSMGCLC